MSWESGSVRAGAIGGADILLHWTLPLGLLMWGGGLRPGAWIGVFFVIFAHELGHAWLAWRRKHYVPKIVLWGFGGLTYHTATGGYDRMVIAWGGVMVQAIIFAIAFPIYLVVAPVGVSLLDDLLYALVVPNAILALLNLIPFGGLDGAHAWPLVRYHLDRRRAAKSSAAAKKTKRASHLHVVRDDDDDSGPRYLN